MAGWPWRKRAGGCRACLPCFIRSLWLQNSSRKTGRGSQEQQRCFVVCSPRFTFPEAALLGAEVCRELRGAVWLPEATASHSSVSQGWDQGNNRASSICLCFSKQPPKSKSACQGELAPGPTVIHHSLSLKCACLSSKRMVGGFPLGHHAGHWHLQASSGHLSKRALPLSLQHRC